MNRTKEIIKTSVVGIIVNVFLVAVKATIGLFSNSISIILDAVNNLSDALSSLITIIGTKLSGKKPDVKHPYGYGRIEYLTSVLIAAIVLTAGFTSLKESVLNIIHPGETSYTVPSIIILVIAVFVKIFLGQYFKAKGKKLDSTALVTSGTDAFFDGIISAGTIVVAVINFIWHISLEGVIGAVIAVIVIKAGIEALMESVHSIIGERADPELTKEIKARIASKHDEVLGAYDLVLHNYGPEDTIGSVHIELQDGVTAAEIHRISRNVIEDIYDEYGIVLTVGVYAINNSSEFAKEMRSKIAVIVKNAEGIRGFHGFFCDTERKSVMFDIVVDFGQDTEALKKQVETEILKEYPEYKFNIAVDLFYSD